MTAELCAVRSLPDLLVLVTVLLCGTNVNVARLRGPPDVLHKTSPDVFCNKTRLDSSSDHKDTGAVEEEAKQDPTLGFKTIIDSTSACIGIYKPGMRLQNQHTISMHGKILMHLLACISMFVSATALSHCSQSSKALVCHCSTG